MTSIWSVPSKPKESEGDRMVREWNESVPRKNKPVGDGYVTDVIKELFKKKAIGH